MGNVETGYTTPKSHTVLSGGNLDIRPNFRGELELVAKQYEAKGYRRDCRTDADFQALIDILSQRIGNRNVVDIG